MPYDRSLFSLANDPASGSIILLYSGNPVLREPVGVRSPQLTELINKFLAMQASQAHFNQRIARQELSYYLNRDE